MKAPWFGTIMLGTVVGGCFNPSSVEDTDAAGSGTSSVETGTAPPTSDGPPAGTETSGTTAGPDADSGTMTGEPDDTTSADPTIDPDTSGGIPPECDEPDVPCPEGEYCVAGACSEPPEGMVAVPAGNFWMGCEDPNDTDCLPDQYPFHEVFLDAFAIDRTEATIDEYEACMEAGGCGAPAQENAFGQACTWDNAPNGTYPITCINWFQASSFCEWQGKRLPTEAEWEKAARGTDARLFPWGNDAPTCNHAAANSCTDFAVADGTVPVGSLPLGASPYGALDMAGNVWEWVSDWYDASYYLVSPGQNPGGPASGPRRGLRSCSTNSGWIAAITTFRGVDYDVPTRSDAHRTVGVRCAISATR